MNSKLADLARSAVERREYSGLAISSNMRIIPLSQLTFAVVASKYTAQLHAVYAYAQLDQAGNDVWSAEAKSIPGPTGSIYVEDWHEQEVTDFVVQAVKKFYRDFEREVGKRRELVTTEELQLTKD